MSARFVSAFSASGGTLGDCGAMGMDGALFLRLERPDTYFPPPVRSSIATTPMIASGRAYPGFLGAGGGAAASCGG